MAQLVVTRKTDKGLPKYQNGDESEPFILSGAEDRVLVLKQQGLYRIGQLIPILTQQLLDGQANDKNLELIYIAARHAEEIKKPSYSQTK